MWPISEVTEQPTALGKLRPKMTFSYEDGPLLKVVDAVASKTGKHGSAKVNMKAFRPFVPWEPSEQILGSVSNPCKRVYVENLKGVVQQVLSLDEGLQQYQRMLQRDGGMKLNRNLWLQKLGRQVAGFIFVRQQLEADLDPQAYVVLPYYNHQVAQGLKVSFSYVPGEGARIESLTRPKP